MNEPSILSRSVIPAVTRTRAMTAYENSANSAAPVVVARTAPSLAAN